MKLVVVFFTFVLTLNCWAVQVNKETPFLNVSADTYFILDREKSFQPELDVSGKYSWQQASQFGIKFGYASYPVWMKLELHNPTDERIEKILYFDSALTSHLDFYKGAQHIAIGGSAVPWNQREIKSIFAATNLILEPQETATYYVRRFGVHQLDSQLNIADKESFKEREHEKFSFMLFFVGAGLALLVYNLVIGLSSRVSGFIFYSGFIFSMLMISLNMQGILDKWLSGLAVSISEKLYYFTLVTISFATLFTRSILETKNRSPRIDKLYFVPVIFSVILLFFRGYVDLAGQQIELTSYLVDINVMLALIVVFMGIIEGVISKEFVSYCYGASWVFTFLGVLAYFLSNYGIIGKSVYAANGIQIGFLLEMMVISIALAYKIHILDRKAADSEMNELSKDRYQGLVRTLCHDVANPISIIQGTISLRDLNQEMFEKNMDRNVDKIKRALKNVTDILSKIREQERHMRDQNKLLALEPIALNEVVDEALFVFGEKAKEKDLQILVEQDGLDVDVVADRTTLLNNVFNNVISNAIKFSDQGGVIQVKGSLVREDLIRVTIEDTGVGIPRDLLEQFKRTGEMKSRQGTLGERGTGYGMPLAKAYMEQYGGKFLISSVCRSENPQRSGTKVTLEFKREHF